MELVKQRTLTLEQLSTKLGRSDIELNPSYQRDFVWKKAKQQEFIKYVKSYDVFIHPLTFVELENNRLEVFDGKQRLSTLRDFFRSQDWISMNEDDKQRVLGKEIAVHIVRFENIRQKVEMFHLLNNTGERMDAMSMLLSNSELHDNIKTLSSKIKTIPSPDFIKQKSDLKKLEFFADVILRTWTPTVPKAKLFKNFVGSTAYKTVEKSMVDFSTVKPEIIKTKANRLSSLIKMLGLDSSGSAISAYMKVHPKSSIMMMSILIENLSEAQINDNLLEIKQTVKNYFEDFVSARKNNMIFLEGNQENIVYPKVLEYMKWTFPKPKTKRVFQKHTKEILMLEKDVEHTCFEIDHKIPYSKGGPSTLENAQLLTREENRKKGSSL